jgi:hypothetical protein
VRLARRVDEIRMLVLRAGEKKKASSPLSIADDADADDDADVADDHDDGADDGGDGDADADEDADANNDAIREGGDTGDTGVTPVVAFAYKDNGRFFAGSVGVFAGSIGGGRNGESRPPALPSPPPPPPPPPAPAAAAAAAVAAVFLFSDAARLRDGAAGDAFGVAARMVASVGVYM